MYTNYTNVILLLKKYFKIFWGIVDLGPLDIDELHWNEGELRGSNVESTTILRFIFTPTQFQNVYWAWIIIVSGKTVFSVRFLTMNGEARKKIFWIHDCLHKSFTNE